MRSVNTMVVAIGLALFAAMPSAQRGQSMQPANAAELLARIKRTVREPDLTIPHPELPNRRFWQREIEEIETTNV